MSTNKELVTMTKALLAATDPDAHPIARNCLSALRQKAQEMVDEQENFHVIDYAGNIRAFLASVKPLKGSCFCGDDSYHRGRAAVEQLAAAYATQTDELDPTLAQCADMLEYITRVEPVDPAVHYASGGNETCGMKSILDYVQSCIREHNAGGSHE